MEVRPLEIDSDSGNSSKTAHLLTPLLPYTPLYVSI